MSPLCESYLTLEQLDKKENFYPLHVRLCADCLLVQLPAYVTGEEIFADYAYFSSYSDSWVEHARQYAERMTSELNLTPESLVTEVASNDGYLLRHFATRGVEVLGVEPAANVARVAQENGLRTEVAYLGAEEGQRIAAQYGRADLVVANNVYAHVPDIVGFTRGLAALVKPTGLVTLEFPHLLRLIERRQYDTIYHEHFQYFTLLTVRRALASGGLSICDVEELDTHGGSLRVYARPVSANPTGPAETSARVLEVADAEEKAGLHDVSGHEGFAREVDRVKFALLEFLINARREGKTVVGYGAPGKGNTLLNHCGIRSDLLRYTVDRSPHKQGLFLPGTHIPVYAPERIAFDKPDYVLVLPWNLKTELDKQLSYVHEWGGKLVYPIPALEAV